MAPFTRFFRDGGWLAWTAATLAVATAGVAGFEGIQTYAAYATRDEALGLGSRELATITAARHTLRAVGDSVTSERARGRSKATQPYIVVSLADNRLWVRETGVELYTTRVASGSGRTLAGAGSKEKYKFDTPRGKLTVKSKETSPAWIPPDWHFVEMAGKKKLGLLRMKPGQMIPVSDGVITTRGDDVIKRHRDGSVQILTATEGKELVAGGRLIIPPGETNARKYKEILGTHRLNLGDGYALHGTNVPTSIGHSVSHGCVRLRNEDIETLYRMIPVGTAVYIY